MKKIILLFMVSTSLVAQVGIGTVTPDASSALEIESTSAGILIPRMTEAQRTAIGSPATGLLVYQTNNTAGFWYYSGSVWTALGSSSSWELTGNAGTNPSTDFIGTTDNVDLKFRRNNLEVGDITNYNIAFGESSFVNPVNAYYNVAIGNNAMENITGADGNVAIGWNALQANTNSSALVAIGNGALANNTETNNVAIGSGSMNSNTVGFNNTAVGTESLQSNINGNSNNSFGYYSLYNNIDGNANCAFGVYSLRDNSSGVHNSAFGTQSLQFNTSGKYNTAFGSYSQQQNITGTENTSIGSYSLQNTTSGTRNTSVGYSSGAGNGSDSFNTALGAYAVTNVGYSNATAIGYATTVSSDNTVRIGNNSVTSIGGYSNWSNVSDGRFKTNVREDVVGLDFILKLRPVTYRLDMDAIARFNKLPDSLRLIQAEQLKAKEIQSGFIAQEVEQAAIASKYNFHGVEKPKNENSHYGLRYAEFVVPLVKAMQEQQQILEAQNNRIENLEIQIKELETLIQAKLN